MKCSRNSCGSNAPVLLKRKAAAGRAGEYTGSLHTGQTGGSVKRKAVCIIGIYTGFSTHSGKVSRPVLLFVREHHRERAPVLSTPF